MLNRCLPFAILAFAAFAGCSGDDLTQRGTPAGLNFHMLENATYHSEILPVESFALTDGYFEDQEHQTMVHLSEMHAFGDIDGDEWEDAVVILVSNAGGSGIFHEMAVVLNDAGEPRHHTSTLIGDRVEIRSITIVGNEILLEVTTHGEDDPLCCPTQDVTERYRLDGDQIVLVSSEPSGPASVL